MKTSVKIAVAALVIASFGFEACKKGPNDPFLSLHTRKGRVAGDWKVSAGSGTDVNGSSTTTWSYDGATYTQSGGGSTARTMKMNFEKDGTYKTETVTTTTTPFASTETETSTGTWNFTAGVGDDKNKDHIVMKELSYTDVLTAGSSTSTSTDTYTGDNAPTSLMYIDELKNKEIIFTYDGTTTSGSSTSSSKGSWTLTPQ